MADENALGGEEGSHKCAECKPGLPLWMGTFSDMVTLLLTFFVLLLSFAKTETEKYKAALGSIRNAFGGNVLRQGQVVEQGRSPDDASTILESQEVPQPFPIEFLTIRSILDKFEINREAQEDLDQMKESIKTFSLEDVSKIYLVSEGFKIKITDRIYFKEGKMELESISTDVFEQLIKMLTSEEWSIFVEGHAAIGEVSTDGKMDALAISAERASVVARTLVRRGVLPNKITTIFYGDSRPEKTWGQSDRVSQKLNRRVEFTIRKIDLRKEGQLSN